VGGGWQTFDPRNNAPWSGRTLMPIGRDAGDVALSDAFGAAPSVKCNVVYQPDERAILVERGVC
jgi:transglutaminase-like putative cysteine protease